ncbi:hypothetical protein LY625_02340 [Lysobacter sp. GX 14042]|uniref:hypothetical protein n=1 Tax=Lysobacter sp. GX 14042 TaxID=2907155 RepID=UPI001F193AAE|nr:hypothetical protein [Lysobacter sp. GX 14042]MCE7031473.1 hypothetical protein [Lysobacter sp. GX 14042]
MSLPRRATLLPVAATAALLASGCTGVISKEIATERANLHDSPLELGTEGDPPASIDLSGAVTIGGDTLPLTDAQRALAADYRASVIDLTDHVLEGTAKLTNRAMATALLGAFSGFGDAAERRIERQAEAMVHSDELCGLLEQVRQRQDRMVQAVEALRPHASVSRQDVEDCTAGRPYHAGL